MLVEIAIFVVLILIYWRLGDIEKKIAKYKRPA